MPKPRTGRPVGRPKGAVSAKRRMAHEIIAELEKQLGKPCHPLEGLLRIASDETQPMELRATCYRDALPYVLPKLQQSAVAVAGALEVDNNTTVEIDMNAILMDPELAHAAGKLAIAVAEAEQKQSRLERGLPEAPSMHFLDADYSR